MAATRQPVKAALTALRQFICIDGELHTPPVCLFEWGDVQFQGVATSLKEKFSLFDSDSSNRPPDDAVAEVMQQSKYVRDMKLSSPDRTRVRTVRDGETLAQLSSEARHGDPRLADDRHSGLSNARASSRPGRHCGSPQCEPPTAR